MANRPKGRKVGIKMIIISCTDCYETLTYYDEVNGVTTCRNCGTQTEVKTWADTADYIDDHTDTDTDTDTDTGSLPSCIVPDCWENVDYAQDRFCEVHSRG